MTSKEALYYIKAIKILNDDGTTKPFLVEEINAIEKDLEVLEMFNKHLCYNESTETFTIETTFWKADDVLSEMCFEYWQKHNAEYNKIKEWHEHNKIKEWYEHDK